MLTQFGELQSSVIEKYVQFAHEGARLPSVWVRLQVQIYLGSESFVTKMQAQIEKKAALDKIPRAQRRAITQSLVDFEQRYNCDETMAQVYLSGQHTMAAIARQFLVHYSTVS